MEAKKQHASDGHWLYQDINENERVFCDYVILPETAQYWPECTNDEKEQWEREHAPIEQEPENEQ